jgi:hypothetical protein
MAQAPRQRAPHKPRVVGPWEPVKWENSDAAAVQALYRGDATADQQRRALTWILETAAATYDMSFRPGGLDGARASDFAEGRRFVGNQIRKLIVLNLSAFKEPNG